MISDDQLKRFAKLTTGSSMPVNEDEYIFVEMFNFIFHQNQDPFEFATRINLEGMLDTTEGKRCLAAVMAIKKLQECETLLLTDDNDGECH